MSHLCCWLTELLWYGLNLRLVFFNAYQKGRREEGLLFRVPCLYYGDPTKGGVWAHKYILGIGCSGFYQWRLIWCPPPPPSVSSNLRLAMLWRYCGLISWLLKDLVGSLSYPSMAASYPSGFMVPCYESNVDNQVSCVYLVHWWWRVSTELIFPCLQELVFLSQQGSLHVMPTAVWVTHLFQVVTYTKRLVVDCNCHRLPCHIFYHVHGKPDF